MLPIVLVVHAGRRYISRHPSVLIVQHTCTQLRGCSTGFQPNQEQLYSMALYTVYTPEGRIQIITWEVLWKCYKYPTCYRQRFE